MSTSPVHTILEKPTASHEAEFLEAARRSRSLHSRWVAPPRTSGEYRQYLDRVGRTNQLGFLIRSRSDGDLAGVVNVSEIVLGSFKSAYLGYYAFEPSAGTGLMRDGVRQVIAECFTNIGLHRVEANIQPTNERSIALVKHLGFSLEGFSPRYLKIGGRWRDHERWALVREQWRPSRSG